MTSPTRRSPPPPRRRGSIHGGGPPSPGTVRPTRSLSAPPPDVSVPSTGGSRLPPPVTKRNITATTTMPVQRTTPPRTELEQIATTLGSTDDRKTLADEASRIIKTCVASAAGAGIGPTSEVFHSLWADLLGGFTEAERRRLLQQLLTGLFTSGQIQLLVDRDERFLRGVLTRLIQPGGLMDPGSRDEPERYELVDPLLDTLITKTGSDWLRHEGLDFLVFSVMVANQAVVRRELVLHRQPRREFITAKLALLGHNQPDVAIAFVDAYWAAPPEHIGRDLITWIHYAIDDRTKWNTAGTGLAARFLNLLWTAGQYDVIRDLIAAGVDCTKPAKAWGVRNREGVYNGYVQPLTHLLSRYLKPISMLDTPDEASLANVNKVRKAQQVVEAIAKLRPLPPILLDFTEIKGCPLVESFDTRSGSIWGFEDVRQPYILAARDRRWGQRPLRMLDLWPAIIPMLESYPAFISSPSSTIPDLVRQGSALIEQGVQAGNPDYEGIDLKAYLPEFRTMCTDFLTYLAGRRPYGAYFEPTERSGKASAKLLPSYICKVGIHWSVERRLPLYYCLDGLDMEDVLSYKRYKIKEINGYLGVLGESTERMLHHSPFQEVITLAEVREILHHWDSVKQVIRFVELGKMVPPEEAEDRVRGWQAQLKRADAGLHRSWAQGTTFDEEVTALSHDAAFWVEVGVRERWKCVKESHTIRLAADRLDLDMELLVQVLKQDCPTLSGLALLPPGFVELFRAAVEAHDTERPAALAELREAALLVCPGLRPPLKAAIDRHFGPPPLMPTAPEPLLEVTLHMEPVPDAVPVTIVSTTADHADPGASRPD